MLNVTLPNTHHITLGGKVPLQKILKLSIYMENFMLVKETACFAYSSTWHVVIACIQYDRNVGEPQRNRSLLYSPNKSTRWRTESANQLL